MGLFVSQEKRKKKSILVKLIVIPLSIIAVIFLLLGVYSFQGANQIMKMPHKSIEGFPSNILPVYSNANFESYGDSIKLEGWFFKTKLDPISTVVMVHSHGMTRLQFGTQTVDLYDFFLKNGYNILSFDLRHTGESRGQVSALGYNEWKDILGAISYVKKVSPTRDVILYGFDSGVSASIIAYEMLPESMERPSAEDKEYPDSIMDLGFDQSYIKALIFDAPLADADDYISYVASQELFLGNSLGRLSIPYAVRLSSDIDKGYNIASILSRLDLPVHMIYGEYSDELYLKSCEITVNERVRMFPNKTSVYKMLLEDGGKIIPMSGKFHDKENYLKSIENFLRKTEK